MTGSSDDGSWQFRSDIEGLRAVAIVGVVLFHAGVSRVSGGFLGVDVFFVLSGFLITGILIREVEKTGTVSLPAFWARRARRLLPAATLVTVVTLLFLVRLDSPFAEKRYAASALAFATYWSNMLFWERGADYFDQATTTDPFLHTWSLAVEEQYYLLFAPCVLLVALATRRSAGKGFQRRLLLAALSVTVLSFLGCLLFAAKRPTFAFYGLPTRAWEFGVGSLLALAPARGTWPRSLRYDLVALGALAAVVGAWFVANEQTVQPGMVTLLPVLGTAALIYGGGRGQTAVGRLLESSWMRRLGRLSYSWYLWHWPITIYWSKLAPAGLPLVIGMPLVSLALAQITLILIENPVRYSVWLRPARRGLAAALVLAIVTSAVALATQWRAGQRLLGPEYEFIREARETRSRSSLDGCDAQTNRAACSYGNPGSATTVVLFGDSHAGQWFPALERAVTQRGWRLVVLTFGGCPGLFVSTYTSVPGQRERCLQWRAGAVKRIRELDPALIVMSNWRWHGVLDSADSRPHPPETRPALWERGLRLTLDSLPPASRILMLADTPWPRRDVPSCLVDYLKERERCGFRLDGGIAPQIDRIERQVVRSDPRVKYADLTGLICDASFCSASTGDTVKYSDGSHLSVAFSASLSPWLLTPLDSMLAAPRRKHGNP